jgi:hypothetical protein
MSEELLHWVVVMICGGIAYVACLVDEREQQREDQS